MAVNCDSRCKSYRRGDLSMTEKLSRLLNADNDAKRYFVTLPQYVREAIANHADKIDDVKSMRIYAESFMRDDSFRGA